MGFGFQEFLLLLAIVLLFFGGKHLPKLMASLGSSVRLFKDGLKEDERKVRDVEELEKDSKK